MMNRKSKKLVAATLATATCALLGTSSVTPVNAQEDPGWEFNTALLYYGEDDNRVEDISLSLLALLKGAHAEDFLEQQECQFWCFR